MLVPGVSLHSLTADKSQLQFPIPLQGKKDIQVWCNIFQFFNGSTKIVGKNKFQLLLAWQPNKSYPVVIFGMQHCPVGIKITQIVFYSCYIDRKY